MRHRGTPVWGRRYDRKAFARRAHVAGVSPPARMRWPARGHLRNDPRALG